MKIHALADLLHLLVLTLKSYYVWGMPIYVFIIPLIFVVVILLLILIRNKNTSIQSH